MLRTCVGCRAALSPEGMVRLVLGPEGEVVFDVAGGAFGRGAWVHPRPECLAQAPAGLSRALRSSVRSTALDLHRELVAAAARRVRGLVISARRAHKLEAGSTAVEMAVADGRAALVLVARDARAAADHAWLVPLVARGAALAYGSKDEFGSWLSRPDTALLAVTDRGLGQEIRRMIDWTMLSEPSARANRVRRTVSSEAG